MRFGRWLALAGIVAVAGCVQESASANGGSEYKFETYIPLGITAGGVLALAASVWLFLNRSIRGGFLAGGLGLAGMVFGPNMFFDRAIVDDDHLELRTGFWFSPTSHLVKFDDVASVEGIAEEKTGRRGRKSTSFYFVFRLKSNAVEKVPLGDLMKRGPTDKVVAVLTKRNIPLSGVWPVIDD